MKRLIICLYILAYSSCVYFPSAGELPILYSPKNIIVTKNTDGCEFLGSIKRTEQYWKWENNGDAIPLEIRRIKAKAKKAFPASNAIGNTIVFGYEQPTSQTDVFRCPDEKFQAEKNFQLDDNYVLQNIEIRR